MAPHSDVEIAQSGTTQGRLTIAFLVLSWLFILLRTWTRTYVIQNFGWDDTTMILAGLIFSLYCAALLYIVANGGGTHISSIPQLQKLTKWVVVSEATYVMAMMILKISLGIFFGRIVAKRSHFMFIYAAVGINVFSSAAAFFYVLFRCGANLDDYVIQQLKHNCTPRNLDRFMAYQQAAFTTLTDLMFVMLPILILWNANMSRRSKISVGAILSLATVGCICSILRFRYVEGLTKTDDFFWHAVNIAIWSTIECGTCIIAGCLAALRPLIKHIFKDTPVPALLSRCMKQISSSFNSTRRSTSSSPPHSHGTTTTATTISEPLPPSRKQKHREAVADAPAFMEFIAPPGQEVIALHSDFDQERKSTDRILASPDATALEFPWPVKAQGQRRQTMHVNWTLRRGVGSDGRTCNRPASEPVALGAYEMGRPPV